MKTHWFSGCNLSRFWRFNSKVDMNSYLIVVKFCECWKCFTFGRRGCDLKLGCKIETCMLYAKRTRIVCNSHSICFEHKQNSSVEIKNTLISTQILRPLQVLIHKCQNRCRRNDLCDDKNLQQVDWPKWQPNFRLVQFSTQILRPL